MSPKQTSRTDALLAAVPCRCNALRARAGAGSISDIAAGGLRHRHGRGLAYGGESRAGRGSFRVAVGKSKAGVEDAALVGDGWLRHVQGAAQMEGHVAGARGQVDLGEVAVGLPELGPDEGAVGAGEDAELARFGIGAGDRDADGEATAIVAVTPER